jgi:hypothetical protein
MARAPNYDQERKERDRAKAAKKAEKLAAKAAVRERDAIDTNRGAEPMGVSDD